MKKLHISRISLILVLILSVSLFAFTGCGKSAVAASANQPAASNANDTGNNGTGQQNRAFNRDEMQKQIQVCVDSLVADGKITKEQGDKIEEAYLSNTGRPNGQRAAQNNQQNNGQDNSQGNGQRRARFNPLSKLVDDGTITQAQADLVTQKIRESFPTQNSNQP